MSKRYRVLGGYAWYLIGFTTVDLLLTSMDVMNGHIGTAVIMTICALIMGLCLHIEVRRRTVQKMWIEEGERDARTGND